MLIKTYNVETVAQKIINMIEMEEPITFFSGSGISVLPPACAPQWAELRDKLIEILLNRLVQEKSLSFKKYKSIISGFNKFKTANWVKPEVVLDWLYTGFKDLLFESLAVLNLGEPNLNHKVLAELALRNNSIFMATTNFDLYFEKAFSNFSKKYNIYASSRKMAQIKSFYEFNQKYSRSKQTNNLIPILKLHGTIAEPKSILATLRQVSRPAGKNLEKSLASVVKDKHFIVLGYSGNDFDIFPLIQKYSSKARSLIWFTLDKRNLKKEVHELSGKVSICQGNLNLLFKRLNSKFCHIKNNRIKSNRTNVLRPSLEDWARKIDTNQIAYTLAILGMHLGYFKLSDNMCDVIFNNVSRDEVIYSRALNIYALTYKRRNKRKSLNIYYKAEKLVRPSRNKYSSLYSNILGNIGSVLHEIGYNYKAKKWLFRSNYWAKKSRNWKTFYANYDDLGNVFRVLGKSEKALNYHFLAKDFFEKKEPNLINLALILNNIGLCYIDLEQIDKAEKYIAGSLRLKIRETSDLPATAKGYMNLGELKLFKCELNEAKENFDKASALYKNLKDPFGIARIAYDFSELYRLLGQKKRARKLFEKAEKLSSRLKYWKKDAYRMIWINKIRRNFLKNEED